MSKNEAYVTTEIVRHPKYELVYEVVCVGYRNQTKLNVFEAVRSESKWILSGREIAEAAAIALAGADSVEFMKHFQCDRRKTITIQ